MSLRSLSVALKANVAEFSADMGKAAHKAAKDLEDLQAQASRMGKAIGAAFGVAVGAAALLTKQAIDNADAMNKAAQATGVEVKALSALNYAARLSDVSTESLTTAVGRLNRNIYEAAQGTGEAAAAFEGLGIKVKNADGSLKSADQVMGDVAARFAGLEDGAGKAALAQQIFGKSGAALIPLLNGGADGLKRATDEARKFGSVIDAEAGAAAEAFNDNLTRLTAVKEGLANQIAKAVLPSLQNMTNSLLETARGSNAMDEAARAAATGLRLLFTGGTLVVTVFKSVGDAIGAAAASMVAISEGEFKRAWEIAQEGAGDFVGTTQRAAETIVDIWDTTAASTVQAASRVVQAQAPVIKSASQLAAARREQEQAAKAALAAEARLAEQINKINADIDAADEEAVTKFEEKSQARIQSARDAAAGIAEGMLNEREALVDDYNKKRELIEEARAVDLERTAEYNEQLYDLQYQHERRMAKLEEQGWTERQKFEAKNLKDKAKQVFGQLADITAGVAQHNRKMFELNKVAGIANAIINAYEGISRTLKEYPFPLSVAMAAAQGIAAFAQVQAIQSAQFGGGGGAAPSLAGGTAATPVSPVNGGNPAQGSGQTTIVQLAGQDSMYSDKQVRDLLKRLQESTDKGGKIQFA